MGKFSALQTLVTRIADLDTDLDNGNQNGSSSQRLNSFEFSSDLAPSGQSRTIILPLSEIHVGNRIRKYLDTAKTESLANSIRQHGFRGVLWVRLLHGRYHLIAGGRRYAACQMAGTTEVAVEVWEVTDAEAIQLELLENFQREDLNPIEEVEGVLRMLETTLGMEQSEVVSLLRRKGRQKVDSTDGDTSVPNDESPEDANLFQQIDQVFSLIGKYSAEGFRTHRLPLLNMPQPLIQAVSDGLEYSKARVIAGIKDESMQEHVLSQAVEEGLSRREITELIKQAAEVQPVTLPPEKQVYNRAQQFAKRLRSAKLEGRTLKKVQNLLQQLEELLGQDQD